MWFHLFGIVFKSVMKITENFNEIVFPCLAWSHFNAQHRKDKQIKRLEFWHWQKPVRWWNVLYRLSKHLNENQLSSENVISLLWQQLPAAEEAEEDWRDYRIFILNWRVWQKPLQIRKVSTSVIWFKPGENLIYFIPLWVRERACEMKGSEKEKEDPTTLRRPSSEK